MAEQRKRRLPPWLKRRLPAGRKASEVSSLLADLGLHTVCAGAHCPNQGECFQRGTATFLILGPTCTRNCRFCAIEPSRPAAVRADEPEAIAEAAARLGLEYVVITSVTRDDLADGGAGHFARTIQQVRRRLPAARAEVLVPDFQGRKEDLQTVLAAGPDVLNHNVETVSRLYPAVRPQADYDRSLRLLATAKSHAPPGMLTKSGLMVGLGEEADEIRTVLADLRRCGCDIVTIGQYLAPSPAHHPVVRYMPPEEFAQWEAEAKTMGFAAVAAGPFVRSSYRADKLMPPAQRRDTDEGRPDARGQ